MRAGLVIFAVAAALRTAFLFSWMVPASWILAGAHGEVDATARTLAATGRFADPYLIPTGPTAHPLPIQTALQAGLFLVFGDTSTAAYARSLAGILSCAAFLALLPWFSRRLGTGERAGIVAGAVGAVLPLNGTFDLLGLLWNESLAGIALTLLAVLFVDRWRGPSAPLPVASLWLGLGAGVSFHLAPALFPVVLGYLLFELSSSRRRGRDSALVVVGAVVVCAPWACRNAIALHVPVFVRSNFGLELSLANRDGARADLWRPGYVPFHPGRSLVEAQSVRDLGEGEYMRRKLRGATAWIREHPVEFASLTFSRGWHVWLGPPDRPHVALPTAVLSLLALLGLRRALPGMDRPTRAAIVIPLAAYPLVTYLVAWIPRYLFPLSGLLLVLAAGEVLALATRKSPMP